MVGDRAQLVLVGAIAIGIVLIAMTTVLNSAVFTENVAQGNSVEVAEDVREFDRGAIRNVRSLAIRVNHAEEYQPGMSNDLLPAQRSNVSNYSRVLAISYADTGSVYVNITYEDETMGGRVVQDVDDDFTDNGAGAGGDTWTVASDTDTYRLGWFVMNVDVENVSQTDPVFVELKNETGSELNVSLRQTSDGDLEVQSSIDGGSVTGGPCEPKNGRVLVDVVGGDTYTGDCTFYGTEDLSGPYTELRFVNGDEGIGKYDLVINRSSPSVLGGLPACAAPQEPCRTVAVWSVDFSTHYRTAAVRYDRNHTVEVYGG